MTVSETAFSAEKGRSRLRQFWEGISVIFRSRVAVIGLSIVLFWILVAIFAPFIAKHDPLAQNAQAINQGPSSTYWLGTDHLGRDIMARLAYGSRTILLLAPISVLAFCHCRNGVGAGGGYFGGWVDELVMRILDCHHGVPDHPACT
jgi:peptide/nickel transport system permease protein